MRASEAGLNPYAGSGIGAEKPYDSPGGTTIIDPRAKGLDGDILEQFMKGRWQEGHQTGYADGHAAARTRFAGVFDDGYDAGQQNGLFAARAQMAAELRGRIARIQAAFTDVLTKTGSENVGAIAEAGLREAAGLIEVIAGIAPPSSPAAEPADNAEPADVA